MRALFLALSTLCASVQAQDRSELLDVGSAVPELTCSDQAGKRLTWNGRWKGKGVVVLFHSVGMTYSERALQEIAKDWESTSALAGKLGVLVVTGNRQSVDSLKQLLAKSRLDVAFTVDPDRTAFKQYKVIAFPTILVISRDRRVLHIDRGYGPRLATKVNAASKHAAGLIDQTGYDKIVNATDTQKQSAAYIRVARTVPMANKLIASGMLTEACDTLAKVMPSDIDHLGGIALLADMYLRLEKKEKARPWIHRLKNFDPENAKLPYLWAGLAIQDGDATTAHRHLATQDPNNPKTGYLSGQAYELQKKFELAARSYRMAMRAMMNRRVR